MARFRPDPLRVDAALAAVLTAAAQLAVWWEGGARVAHHRLGYALLAALVTGAVAVRRRFPFALGLAAVGAGGFQIAFWGDPQLLPESVAWFLLLYAFTVWTTPRRFAVGIGTMIVLYAAAAAGPKATLSNTAFFTIVSLVVMLIVRGVLGDRERRALLAERERDVAAREAVVEERARIARELHDAIAHNVSMMVVQAGAERRVLDPGQRSTAEVLQTIEQIGRGALTEMRRLVGMLRSSGDEPLRPQPGLDDLGTLVAQVRDAGLPVELSVEGERRELPVGIELSAYRIVQEALTNALKHAGDARASVRVAYGVDALELEIVDDGPGGTVAVAGGGGNGLVGMRERVALYGGRFDAGRQASGGFRVRVLLPVR